jgi:hypothetical protein
MVKSSHVEGPIPIEVWGEFDSLFQAMLTHNSFFTERIPLISFPRLAVSLFSGLLVDRSAQSHFPLFGGNVNAKSTRLGLRNSAPLPKKLVSGFGDSVVAEQNSYNRPSVLVLVRVHSWLS